MTRKGPAKSADAQFGAGRLDVARAFLKTARALADSLGEKEIANPVFSLIVHAAIAYADALTAKTAGMVNTQDHAAAPKLLRAALRDRLPSEQERRFVRILAEKTEAEYGVRVTRGAEAARLLADLEKFAAWVEIEMARRR